MTERRLIDFNSIRGRIIMAVLAAGIMVIFVTAFAGFKIFERTLVGEIGSNRSDVLSQIGDRVRQIKNNSYLISNLYYYDGKLTSLAEAFLESGSGEDEEVLVAYLDSLTSQYKKSLYEEEMDYEVHLILENGWGYNSGEKDRMEKSLIPKNKIWYKDMLRAQGEIVDVANYKDKAAGKSYFYAARSIFDEEGEPIACLVIAVDERKIYNMYCRVISGGGTIYIIDDEGTIISSSDETINGFNLFNMENLDKLFGDKEYAITKMYGENIVFARYADEASGFTVLEKIQLDTLLAPLRQVRMNIIFLALVMTAILIACACVLAGRLARPIFRLCDFLQQIDEDSLMEKCEVRGYTEINILSEKVNFLLVKIQMLLEGIRKEEQQKRKMELGFLQAQINPHFMYNTLFSVKCMVDMNRNREAAGMLSSFIQLLRSTLSNPDEFVTVESEFEVLRQYVQIQRCRYNDGFQVEFECGEEARRKKIPKLLIQPLLENAIFHGVELRHGDGLIIIIARVSGEVLTITVEDNGVGIPSDILERIERGENVSEKTQIGLQNIRERIQLNFGKSYGMKIESQQWEGTKITLTLPAVE